MAEKIKGILQKDEDIPKDLFLTIVILLCTISGFLAGKSYQQESAYHSDNIVVTDGGMTMPDPKVTTRTNTASVAHSAATNISQTHTTSEGYAYVASKNGSVYYAPNCTGAKRIKDENKIWFSTIQEAKDLGYRPAANCKGLE